MTWLPRGAAGVDAGATLTKLVFRGDRLEQLRLPSGDRQAIGDRLRGWQPTRVGLSGGGARRWLQEMAEILGPTARRRLSSEFEAWARGAAALGEQQGLDLPDDFVLTSVGTGTSVMAIRQLVPERLGGTATGGGTLLGLGHLLLGCDSFEEIVRLAQAGDRRRVDLLVGDVYSHGGSELPAELPADLTAANFGKLQSRTPQDLAAALVGLVGETVGLCAVQLAQGAGLDTLLFCGSTVEGNPPLAALLRNLSSALGCRTLELEEGSYCGAVGAALLAVDGPPGPGSEVEDAG